MSLDKDKRWAIQVSKLELPLRFLVGLDKNFYRSS